MLPHCRSGRLGSFTWADRLFADLSQQTNSVLQDCPQPLVTVGTAPNESTKVSGETKEDDPIIPKAANLQDCLLLS